MNQVIFIKKKRKEKKIVVRCNPIEAKKECDSTSLVGADQLLYYFFFVFN